MFLKAFDIKPHKNSRLCCSELKCSMTLFWCDVLISDTSQNIHLHYTPAKQIFLGGGGYTGISLSVRLFVYKILPVVSVKALVGVLSHGHLVTSLVLSEKGNFLTVFLYKVICKWLNFLIFYILFCFDMTCFCA